MHYKLQICYRYITVSTGEREAAQFISYSIFWDVIISDSLAHNYGQIYKILAPSDFCVKFW